MKANSQRSIFLVAVLILSFFSLSSPISLADENKVKMNFVNEDLIKVIEFYSKVSGQKFIVDPVVRGKITLIFPTPITTGEVFNNLSSALAVNGFAMSRQGDVLIVKSSRSIQRDLLEVGTELPPLKPERLFTWVYEPRYIASDDILKQLRILTSKDGEAVMLDKTNRVVMTDWVSNLYRVREILKLVDVEAPVSPTRATKAAKPKK